MRTAAARVSERHSSRASDLLDAAPTCCRYPDVPGKIRTSDERDVRPAAPAPLAREVFFKCVDCNIRGNRDSSVPAMQAMNDAGALPNACPVRASHRRFASALIICTLPYCISCTNVRTRMKVGPRDAATLTPSEARRYGRAEGGRDLLRQQPSLRSTGTLPRPAWHSSENAPSGRFLRGRSDLSELGLLATRSNREYHPRRL